MARRARWTDDMVVELRSLYPSVRAADIAARIGGVTPSQVYQKAWSLGLKKDPETIARLAREAMLKPGHPGRACQFKKGLVPHNKGLRRPGWSVGRMAETQFKKGHLGGRAAQVVKPVGFERLSKDGYLQRKINNDLPFCRRWQSVHSIVWEAAHGKIPRGMVVVFKPGMFTTTSQDITVEKLECITRRELMMRNSLHTNYPREVRHLIQLRAAITRQIHKRQRSAK